MLHVPLVPARDLFFMDGREKYSDFQRFSATCFYLNINIVKGLVLSFMNGPLSKLDFVGILYLS